jgi:hypothetical protein
LHAIYASAYTTVSEVRQRKIARDGKNAREWYTRGRLCARRTGFNRDQNLVRLHAAWQSAYLVAVRTREFGIRMALGAEPAQLVRLVLRHGAGLTALGLAVGVGLAVALTRVLQGVLYGVGPTDPETFGTIAAILAATALVAYLVPARRAARVEPSVSLRSE